MGKIWMPGGGGTGGGSDDCTAAKGQVLTGYTAVTKDSDDEAAAGAMPNHGAWASRIGVNGRAAVPAGYHNGSGYVDQAITNRGAVNASLGINGTYMIPEGYHNGAGKVAQSIPTMGSQTVAPGNTQKVVSCSGKYMTGNVTVPAVSNLIAANIKKGVNVGGVIGTWEGFVPGNGDIYSQGSMGLASGFIVVPYNLPGEGVGWFSTVKNKIEYETGHITLRAGYYQILVTANSINLTGFTSMNVDFVSNKNGDVMLSVNSAQYQSLVHGADKYLNTSCQKNIRKTASLDISEINGNRYIFFGKYAGGVDSDNLYGLDSLYTYVYRIWLS